MIWLIEIRETLVDVRFRVLTQVIEQDNQTIQEILPNNCSNK